MTADVHEVNGVKVEFEGKTGCNEDQVMQREGDLKHNCNGIVVEDERELSDDSYVYVDGEVEVQSELRVTDEQEVGVDDPKLDKVAGLGDFVANGGHFGHGSREEEVKEVESHEPPLNSNVGAANGTVECDGESKNENQVESEESSASEEVIAAIISMTTMEGLNSDDQLDAVNEVEPSIAVVETESSGENFHVFVNGIKEIELPNSADLVDAEKAVASTCEVDVVSVPLSQQQISSGSDQPNLLVKEETEVLEKDDHAEQPIRSSTDVLDTAELEAESFDQPMNPIAKVDQPSESNSSLNITADNGDLNSDESATEVVETNPLVPLDEVLQLETDNTLAEIREIEAATASDATLESNNVDNLVKELEIAEPAVCLSGSKEEEVSNTDALETIKGDSELDLVVEAPEEQTSEVPEQQCSDAADGGQEKKVDTIKAPCEEDRDAADEEEKKELLESSDVAEASPETVEVNDMAVLEADVVVKCTGDSLNSSTETQLDEDSVDFPSLKGHADDDEASNSATRAFLPRGSYKDALSSIAKKGLSSSPDSFQEFDGYPDSARNDLSRDVVEDLNKNAAPTVVDTQEKCVSPPQMDEAAHQLNGDSSAVVENVDDAGPVSNSTVPEVGTKEVPESIPVPVEPIAMNSSNQSEEEVHVDRSLPIAVEVSSLDSFAQPSIGSSDCSAQPIVTSSDSSAPGDQVAAPVPASPDVQKPDGEAVAKKVYAIVKCPRSIYYNQIKDQISMAHAQVLEKTQKRDAISAVIRKKQEQRSAIVQHIRDIRSSSRAAKDAHVATRNEIDSIRKGIQQAASVEEYDEMISSLQHRIEHETVSLKEEKQMIKNIKDLKLARDKVVARLGPPTEIIDALNNKDEVEKRIKLLQGELSSHSMEIGKVDDTIKAIEVELKALEQEIAELQDQQETANTSRQDAFVDWKNLQKQDHEKNKYFYEYRRDSQAARHHAELKDLIALEGHCFNQMERVMRMWNNNDDFRREYMKNNEPSTLRRLGRLDGTRADEDEKQRNILERAKAEAISLASAEKAARVSASVPDVPGAVDSKSEKGSHGKSANENLLVKVSASKSKGPVTEIVVEGSPTVSGRVESVEEDKMETKRSAEEELARREEVRKEEAAVRLKEQCRLEEIAKAKEAEERKKRNAERAKAKAELRAQKEAERKEKEREKKARKKAAGASAVAEETVVEGDTEISSDATTGLQSSSVAEVEDKCESSSSTGGVKRSVRSTQVFRSKLSRPLPPPPFMRKNRKKIQPWMWASMAVILVVLSVVLVTKFSILGEEASTTYP